MYIRIYVDTILSSCRDAHTYRVNVDIEFFIYMVSSFGTEVWVEATHGHVEKTEDRHVDK